MRGKYSIEIYNNKLHYQFEVKRNITIIQGNSATGKTTLINMIAGNNFSPSNYVAFHLMQDTIIQNGI